MADQSISVLIVGATGRLGEQITRQCLKRPNLRVNILVRDPSKNKELCQEVEKAGGKCIQGDITKPETITDCTKGIHTVISTVIGSNEVVLDGQKNLLDDALKNGVKRFVPSDFSFDIFNMNLGEHYFTDQRLKFRILLDNSGILPLHVSNGFFMEAYFYLNPDKFSYWENIDQKIDLTMQEDVGKYVAAAVSNPNRWGDLKIVGDEKSTREIVEIFNKITGKNFKAVNQGTIEDLINFSKEMKKQGKLYESIQSGYAIPVYSGKGKILKKDNNEFPDIKPITVEEFVKKYYGKIEYDFPIPHIVDKARDEILAS